MSDKYEYSSKHEQDGYLYRIVSFSYDAPIHKIKNNAYNKYILKQLLSESEWRSVKIVMSPGWEHIGYIKDSMAFKKKVEPVSTKSEVDPTQAKNEYKDIDNPNKDNSIMEELYSSMSIIPVKSTYTTDPQQERYAYLRCMCNKYHIEYPYNQPELKENMYKILLDWMQEVRTKMGINQEAFSMSSYILHLFLSKTQHSPVRRCNLQLYGIVVLDIAAKIEVDHYLPETRDWTYLCANSYTKEQIVSAQKTVIRELEGQILLPSIHRIITSFIQEHNITDERKIALMYYLSNVAIVNIIFPKYTAYTVAEVCFSMVAEVDFIPQYAEQYTSCYNDIKLASVTIHISKYTNVIHQYNILRKKLGQTPITAKSDEIKELNLESVLNTAKDIIPERIKKYHALTEELLSYKNTVQTTVIADNKQDIKKEHLGYGTYGTVDVVQQDDKRQAAKKYFQKYILDIGVDYDTIMEIAITTQLRHKNIIHINKFCIPTGDENTVIYMDVMRSFINYINVINLTIQQVKNFTEQLLNGLNHLHNFDIIHRDLKPHNLLLDGDTLKIADFGGSLWVDTNAKATYNHDVTTLWYSAPEILLEKSYGKAIDIWSVGCILLQMVVKKAVFMGDNKNEQLFEIVKYIDLNDFIMSDKDKFVDKYKYFPPAGIMKIIKNRSSEWNKNPYDLHNLVDLASHMLAIDSNYRYSAKQALEHPFFASLPV